MKSYRNVAFCPKLASGQLPIRRIRGAWPAGCACAPLGAMQDLPRSHGWIVLGVTAVEAAAGYFLIRYAFHASIWWLLSFFPVVALGLWIVFWPASMVRFSKKVEDATRMSPDYPRDFFP
jgi:hypothetical protein